MKTYKIECAMCGKSYQSDKRRAQTIAKKLEQDPDYLKTYLCQSCRRSKGAEPKANVNEPKVSKPKVVIHTDMVGIQAELKEIYELLKYGSKPIIIGGYHGLGKTSMVYDVAKHLNADVIRLQVTELLTEVDIIGGLDPNTGNFIYSEFVKKIKEAIANPHKQYILLIDEFTRGREEAMECLFPVFAENMLVINSPYAQEKHIQITSNVKVLATGNIKDRGVRDVGGAEFDRFNGIEIYPLSSKTDLKKMLAKSGLKDIQVVEKLVEFYRLSWEYGNEMRILPMSHRTLREVAQICQSKIDDGFDSMNVLKETLKQTYFVSSQALLNPNFKNTYDTMVREAL